MKAHLEGGLISPSKHTANSSTLAGSVKSMLGVTAPKYHGFPSKLVDKAQEDSKWPARSPATIDGKSG